MGFLQAIRQGSSLFQEERAEGWIEGREEGREEGRVEALRDSLRISLHARFPDLEQMPEIDRIENIDTLKRLLDSIFHVADAEAMRRTIVTAATKD